MSCLQKTASNQSGHVIGRRRRSLLHLPPMALLPLLLVMAMVDCASAFDDAPPIGMIREIRVGMAAHDVDGLWSGESKEKGPDISTELVVNRALFNLFDAAAYPNLGATINTRGHTSKLFGGFRLEWVVLEKWVFSTGLGLALHNGERDTDQPDRKSLGSQVLFRVPIEIGWVFTAHHRVVLAFDHISNAYLSSPNEGMDTLGVMIGYRF